MYMSHPLLIVFYDGPLLFGALGFQSPTSLTLVASVKSAPEIYAVLCVSPWYPTQNFVPGSCDRMRTTAFGGSNGRRGPGIEKHEGLGDFGASPCKPEPRGRSSGCDGLKLPSCEGPASISFLQSEECLLLLHHNAEGASRHRQLGSSEFRRHSCRPGTLA